MSYEEAFRYLTDSEDGRYVEGVTESRKRVIRRVTQARGYLCSTISCGTTKRKKAVNDNGLQTLKDNNRSCSQSMMTL